MIVLSYHFLIKLTNMTNCRTRGYAVKLINARETTIIITCSTDNVSCTRQSTKPDMEEKMTMENLVNFNSLLLYTRNINVKPFFISFYSNRSIL